MHTPHRSPVWTLLVFVLLTTLGCRSQNFFVKLEHQGHNVDYWLKLLASSNAEERQTASFGLPDHLRVMIGAAQNVEARRDLEVVLVDVRQALVKALRDSEPGIRDMSVTSLAQLGRSAAPAIPDIKVLLADTSDKVREQAAYALSKVGPEARTALPELTAALKDKERGVRYWAAAALGELGADGAPAVPDLIAVMGAEGNPADAAEGSLEKIGAPAVPQLETVLTSPSGRLRILAGSVLYRIQKERAPLSKLVSVYVEGLKEKGWGERWRAAEGLRAMGPPAQAAIAPLIEHLADPDEHVASSCASALSEIGEPALAALTKAEPTLPERARPNAADALKWGREKLAGTKR